MITKFFTIKKPKTTFLIEKTTGLEPGGECWTSASIFRSIRVVYIIINSTLLFSESETSLMERISSEEGDILGHKGTKTTHHVFLGDSAGDQNDTCVQLH